MGRAYAGILGPIAFVTVILRGMSDGASVEGTMRYACLSLFIFAGIGLVIGSVAESIVKQSVRATLAAELNSQEGTDDAKLPTS